MCLYHELVPTEQILLLSQGANTLLNSMSRYSVASGVLKNVTLMDAVSDDVRVRNRQSEHLRFTDHCIQFPLIIWDEADGANYSSYKSFNWNIPASHLTTY